MGDAPLRPGESIRIRGERWRVAAAGGAFVHVRGAEAGNRHTSTAFLTSVERIERLPPPLARVVRRSRWRSAVRAILAEASPPDSLIAARQARINLYSYQLEPALAVVRGLGVRLLVADEVGLGKTVQAGLIAAETLARTHDARVLVVSPAGLREQWQAELRRFDIDAPIIDSTFLGAMAGTGTPNPWEATPVAITSIDFVKRPEVVRAVESIVWDLVVFDEAHALAGRSDRALAASAVAERARRVVLLTATPHSGDNGAFERMAELGNIDSRFPLLVFRRTRQDAGFAAGRRTTWLRVRPTDAEASMHVAIERYARAMWADRGRHDTAARLVAGILMRRACSSAVALAQSLHRRIELLGAGPDHTPQLALPFDDGVDERVLAAAGLGDRQAESRMLVELLAIAREAAGHESKPDVLARLLRRARQPAIVFTEYRDTLAVLGRQLARFSPLLLHGALTRSERREVVEAFTSGDAPLVLATDAASEGLNLQARCRLVINLELPWTPLRLEQRVGRVERIGQRHRVHAVHLVAASTSEEQTAEILARRTTLVDRALQTMRAPAASELAVATTLLGIDGPPDPPAASAAVMVVPDLRIAGIAEAARVARARVLAERAAAAPPSWPVVSRWRRPRARFSACCAYRYVLADERGEFAVEWLSAFVTPRGFTARGSDVRGRLKATEALLLARVQEHVRQVSSSFSAAGSEAIEAATVREQAILDAMLRRRSRLAHRLVQRGLFDRRAERTADAQEAVRREACDRCHGRLRALRRLASPVVCDRSLAFALFTD